MMNGIGNFENKGAYRKLSWFALLVGLIGTIMAGYGLYQGYELGEGRAVTSWLLGFGVWFSISIGMLFLIIISYLFDAGWSVIVRRQLEHAVGFFPWLAVLFLPLLVIGWSKGHPGILWEWNDVKEVLAGTHEMVGEDPLYQHKAGFLNIKFFTIRVGIYFTVLCYLGWVFRRRSYGMDLDSNVRKVVCARRHAALGVFLLAMTSTFAAFDFFMSLSYHWFSTMYGVWFFATSMRAGLAMTVVICVLLGKYGYLKGIFNRGHLYNLGCMFLAFTVFWAYISFSQYFLIYNANVPEETFWYNIRELTHTGEASSWLWVSVYGLILGYFVVPFLALLFYKTKVVRSRMLMVSFWIAICHILDLYFNIVPKKVVAENAVGYIIEQFSVSIWDLSAIIGFGGLFIWSFLRNAVKRMPIPVHDPRIEESLNYHE